MPIIPSAHDSAVASNLLHFCRTVLAAHSESPETNTSAERSGEARNSFSVSTFCSNVIDLDKSLSATEGHLQPNNVKRQRL